MHERDTLLTLAEIAAAFVGFSTIVVVFRSSRSELQRVRLRGVAEIGIAVIVGAFLPVLLSGAGLESAGLWRVSSLVLAPVTLIGWLLWARATKRAGHPPAFGKPPFAPDVLANLAGQLLLWWNVVSPSESAPIRYVTALIAFLLIAAMSFVASAFGTAAEESAALDRVEDA
jgi:hypothetical protein